MASGSISENLSKIDRKSVEHLSNVYRTSIDNLSKIYGSGVYLGCIWGVSGVYLGWIWVGSWVYLGWGLGAPQYGDYVRTSWKNVIFLPEWRFLVNFSFRALKLAANREKQLFTCFGFLPPYFGVSASLVVSLDKNLTRSIDPYQKFFISCRLARYSKIYRTSIENLSSIYRESIANPSGKAHERHSGWV